MPVQSPGLVPVYTVNTVQGVLDVNEIMDARNAKDEDARTARNAKECMSKSENGQSEVGSVHTDDMYRNAKNGQSGLKARSLTVNNKTRTKTSNNIRSANNKNNSGRTILPTDSTPVKRKLVEENNVRSLISRFENLTLSDPRRG